MDVALEEILSALAALGDEPQISEHEQRSGTQKKHLRKSEPSVDACPLSPERVKRHPPKTAGNLVLEAPGFCLTPLG